MLSYLCHAVMDRLAMLAGWRCNTAHAGKDAAE
jgi:hypothetical protein